MLYSIHMSRRSWEEYFMAMANLIACRSPCERLHVGCVLVRDRRVISSGYNGFLPGAPHTSRVVDGHEQSTVHAEQNCITDCARRGVATDGATAYITHYPCPHCTKILISAGIRKICYSCAYRNDPLSASLADDAKVPLLHVGVNSDLELGRTT